MPRYVTADPRVSPGLNGDVGHVVHYVTGHVTTVLVKNGTSATSWTTFRSDENEREGPIGPQGVQGNQGNTGNTGATGPQGIQGDELTRAQDLFRTSKVGYALATSFTTAATTETPFLLFTNTTGSDKVVEVFEQIVSIPAAASSVRSTVRIYKNPTVTLAGSAVAIGGLRSGQAATVCTSTVMPTLSAFGTLVQIYGLGGGTAVQRSINLTRFVEAGDTIAITVECSSVTTLHSFTQSWAETAA